jgi:hypothetical protein
LTILCLTLLGYALFDRGWAYAGFPPVYVGELVLLGGVVWLVRFGNLSGTLDVAPVAFVLALMAWSLLRTCPYVSTYGIDALRDAVLWGYSAFAIIVFLYLRADPRRLVLLLRWYRLFARIFLIAIPLVWLVRWTLGDSLPHWPWAPEVSLVEAKAGQVNVHLAGILAFWVAGLGAASDLWVLLLAFYVPVMAAYERSGLLAFLAASAVCLLHRRNRHFWSRLVAVWVFGFLMLFVTDARFVIPGRGREVSFRSFVATFASIASETDTGDLDATKQWRLDWWNDIIHYTVFGDYFWTGKGFGINLADDDNYQGTSWEGRLRSPHNSHLTVLARAGVPGFILWALVHLTWAWSVFRAYLSSRARGLSRWSGLFLFLLAYWLAFVVNASFDVFLEGPMAGIWCWTIYGVGLGAVWIYRHQPRVLDGIAAPA